MRKSKHRRIKRNDRWYRKPSNQKYKRRPWIRPGARPIDSWDDIPTDHELKMVSNHIDAMIKKGWDRDKIITKVEAKWGMKKHVAIDVVKDSIEWEESSQWMKGYHKERRENRIKELKSEMKESWNKDESYQVGKFEHGLVNKILNETWNEWVIEQNYPKEKEERFRYLKKRK